MCVGFDRKWFNKAYFYCIVDVSRMWFKEAKTDFIVIYRERYCMSLTLCMEFLYFYTSITLWLCSLSIFKERWRERLEGILFHHSAWDGAWHPPLSERHCCLWLTQVDWSPFLWSYGEKVHEAKSPQWQLVSGHQKTTYLWLSAVKHLAVKAGKGLGALLASGASMQTSSWEGGEATQPDE